MYGTILYPTDGSEPAEAAFEHALALAAQFDATLHVVYVLKTNEPAPNVEESDAEGDSETDGKAAVETAARDGAECGNETVEAVLRGPTAEAILEYATAKGVDLVVMRPHGHAALDRLVIGGLTDEVVRGAGVPLVVCGTADH